MPSINLRSARDYKAVCASLNGDQPNALEDMCEWLLNPVGNYYILAGYAGTGKTYLTAALIKLAQQVSWGNIAVTCPTHQAKMNLSIHLKLHGVNTGSKSLNVSTIHSFLGMGEQIDDDGRIQFVPTGGKDGYSEEGCDLLICDEVSMIGQLLNPYIEDAHTDFKGKVLFVGDPMQIPPVGESDSSIFSRWKEKDPKFFGCSWLKSIVRQQEGSRIIGIATLVRQHLEKGDILLRYPNLNDFLGNDQLFREDGFRLGKAKEIIDLSPEQHNPRFVKLLGYRNTVVDFMNATVRAYLDKSRGGTGVIPRYVVGESLILTAPLMDEGRKQVILPNNSEVTILDVEEFLDGEGEYTYPAHRLVVKCPDVSGDSEILLKPSPHDATYGKIVKLLVDYAKAQKKGSYQSKGAWGEYYAFIRQYTPCKYSFAITAHRSQGSTYGWSIIDEADIFSNSNREEAGRVAYTAITRASEGVVILRSKKIK
jgi:exodeoxyribonuclease V